MFRPPSKHWLWPLTPLFAAAFIAGAYFLFYTGTYEGPPANVPPVEQISVQLPLIRGFVAVLPSREGALLVDMAHFNNFDEEKINTLLSRVSDIGYAVEILDRRGQLTEELETSDSFLVVLPQTPYSDEEVAIVQGFVETGGKLVLLGDPGRRSEINSLARGFGMIFQPGYLYNVAEHDVNFQNIFVRELHLDDVTLGIEQIVLYNAGSIKSSGLPLALTDGNTYSSMVERTEAFAPLVKAGNNRILAIADLTFLSPPHNVVWDNERLIANLADYITTSERVLFE